MSAGASDADYYLIGGITASIIIGIVVGALIWADAPDWSVYVIGGVAGGLASIFTSIGIVAKGVEVGNRR